MTDLATAAQIIDGGGVVAYPTESCFGLGCDPNNIEAIRRILVMKKRQRDKGLILIADRFERFKSFLAPLSDECRETVFDSWPGPNTWLWPVADGVTPWLTGTFETLAVRVTAHPLAAKLSQRCGMALVSTSANRAARPALRSASQVSREFGDEVDGILAGRIGGDDAPSTIRDARTGAVIRS